jgi:hypothetical protein
MQGKYVIKTFPKRYFMHKAGTSYISIELISGMSYDTSVMNV